MISAVQATPIAYVSDGGSFIHMDCLDEDIRQRAREYAKNTGVDREFYNYVLDEYGWQVLSRYDIGQEESFRYSDAEHSDPRVRNMREQAEALEDAVSALDTIERVGPGWTAALEWDEGTTWIDETQDKLDDMRIDLEAEIEEMIDDLSAVYCDECGKRIE